MAWRCGVAFVRGIRFDAQGQGGAQNLRLNFAASSLPRIKQGIARLCRAKQELITQNAAD